jgi:FkbM family methyltransferase
MKLIHPESIPDWLIKEVQEYFVPLPFEPQSILDIGANIGAFAQLALERWPSTRIICCEPMPFNVTRLRHAVGNRATILSAAIRAHSGIDEIYLGDNLVTGGFVQLGRQTQHRIVVECLAAHELPSCELVKVDTEGCELEILMNLKLDQTRAVWVEYHSLADAQAIRGLLERDFELQTQVPNNALGTMAFVRV